MKQQSVKIFAAASGFTCVLLGAFAAHGLKGQLSTYQLDIWHTAVFYQFVHTLVLLYVSQLKSDCQLIEWSKYAFVIGILLFSGSLYLLSLSAIKWLGMVTPIGGVGLLIGWLLLLISSIKSKS